MLYIGLGVNALRFFYISQLDNPYYVLPFEFVQGLTHAAVWAAASSYMSLNAPSHQKAWAQHLMQGLHHGVGKGSGTIISGFIITYYGWQPLPTIIIIINSRLFVTTRY